MTATTTCAASVNGADLARQLESAVDELHSIADWVRFGASQFERAGVFLGHGTDDPVDEACALVLHALALQPGLPTELWSARLTRGERDAVARLMARRIEERLPVPYLIGKAWFAGLEFEVDPRVLIPRSPIAELIEVGFEPWLEGRSPERILDLCTGSGCIAIACAAAFPESRVDASDACSAALAVAWRNVERHGMSEQVRLVESDLFRQLDGPYDLIVSNPPYVPREDLDHLPVEYTHEPRFALEAGDDGLACVRRMLEQAPAYLAEDGLLVLEVGVARDAFEAAYPELPVCWPEFARGGGDVLVLEASALV